MSTNKAASVLELDRLIEAVAANGDRVAFGVLFGHVAPRVKAFIIRSGASSDVAEEIAQETLLTVWRKAGQFDASRASAMTWIFTIARNLRIDWLRKASRVEALDSAPEEEDPSPSPEVRADTNTREERVRLAVRALSAEQQEIVRLSFFGEKSHSEIAAELGLPLGTAKSRVRLALAKLRRLLGTAS